MKVNMLVRGVFLSAQCFWIHHGPSISGYDILQMFTLFIPKLFWTRASASVLHVKGNLDSETSFLYSSALSGVFLRKQIVQHMFSINPNAH